MGALIISNKMGALILYGSCGALYGSSLNMGALIMQRVCYIALSAACSIYS